MGTIQTKNGHATNHSINQKFLLTQEKILGKTNSGINIYSHILRQFYPDVVPLTLKADDCLPTKNPFNIDRETLWIKKVGNLAHHVDFECAIPSGSAFDFAAMFYKCHDYELLEILNLEMHLGLFPLSEQSKQEQTDTSTFSFFRKPIRNTVPHENISIKSVYELITSDAYKQVTQTLREIQDPKERKDYKTLNLDFVTFSGVFSKRCSKSLKHSSGYLVIDFDNLKDLDSTKRRLLSDREIVTELLFTSPSGNGLKWVISIDLEIGNHLKWFQTIKNYLKGQYNLQVDESGSDLARACFLCHDPNAFINPINLISHE